MKEKIDRSRRIFANEVACICLIIKLVWLAKILTGIKADLGIARKKDKKEKKMVVERGKEKLLSLLFNNLHTNKCFFSLHFQFWTSKLHSRIGRQHLPHPNHHWPRLKKKTRWQPGISPAHNYMETASWTLFSKERQGGGRACRFG